MTPASAPRPRGAHRLLVLSRDSGQVADHQLAQLPSLLRPGDLLVVNDAATLPASLPAPAPAGAPAEVRLVRSGGVLFDGVTGPPPPSYLSPPPRIDAGARLEIAGLAATVTAIGASPRLFDFAFEAEPDSVWAALYLRGRPIQYAHVPEPLELWSVQTLYASRPWAVEAPSAGLGLGGALLSALRARGIGLFAITEGAGLSATGDSALDARLPLPERFEVGAETVEAISRAHARGGRVVAVGTSVARALESAAQTGQLRASSGETDLVIGPSHPLRVADGLLTGLHEPTASHYALLQAFATAAQLYAAYRHAERAGYLGHELGDANLIL